MFRLKEVTSAAELQMAQQIRRQVFVEEQGIPAVLEYDDADSIATHVLAYQDNLAVATGRLLIGADGQGVLGRIAVLPAYRGCGLGGQIVRQLEAYAASNSVRRLLLHPHSYLETFYCALGYQTIPDSESSVGVHRLIAMEKWLTL
jgi:predicted GNAT family N-acyltransferase